VDTALEQQIAAGSVIALDSSAVLAYLDGGEQISGAATHVIDGFVRSGRNPGLVSAVTVTEALVRPFRLAKPAPVGEAGTGGDEYGKTENGTPEPGVPETISTVEDFLRNFPNLTIVPVDYAVAREAARIRAQTGLRTADALVMATAGVSGAGVLVGNDERWRSAVDKLGKPFALCLLSDYIG
jgi:predicted nucleic acid-binding protein